MVSLKKQIRESFLNPVLYFLPLLIFMVTDDFWGLDTAWRISFPVAFFLIFYVYFNYRGVFVWHGVLAVCYLIIGFIVTAIPDVYHSNIVIKHLDEILFILFIGLFFLRKTFLEKIATKTLSYKVPMSNNVNELYRFTKILLVIIVIFVILNSLLDLGKIHLQGYGIAFFRYVYVASILALVIYETIRVFGIRSSLMREDWLPIVNEQGNVIGSSQYQPDSIDNKRLMHPVVRLYFIDNDMLFLQQRKADDKFDAMLWDASVSRHVRMGKSVEDTLKTHTKNIYDLEPTKLVFLTHYVHHGKYDDQYVYLFITCKTEGLNPKKDNVQCAKWWTAKQIDENLNSGIFTDRFMQEFELLKRSGVFEENICNCDCALKNLLKEKTEHSSSIEALR